MLKEMAIAIGVFASASVASAEYDQSGRLELSPYLGAGIPDGYGISLDPGPVAGARFGLWLNQAWSVEASVERLFSKDGSGTGAAMNSFRLNGLWSFLPESSLRPFVTVGFGDEWAQLPGSINRNGFAPNVGAGFRAFIDDRSGFRFDARYVPTYVSTALSGSHWQSNVEVTAGLFFLFGGPKKLAETTVLKDTDADGIPDDRDRCAGTAKGVQVDADGCSVGVADNDKDGVPDIADHCPLTPAMTAVDAYGCPVETK